MSAHNFVKQTDGSFTCSWCTLGSDVQFCSRAPAATATGMHGCATKVAQCLIFRCIHCVSRCCVLCCGLPAFPTLPIFVYCQLINLPGGRKKPPNALPKPLAEVDMASLEQYARKEIDFPGEGEFTIKPLNKQTPSSSATTPSKRSRASSAANRPCNPSNSTAAHAPVAARAQLDETVIDDAAAASHDMPIEITTDDQLQHYIRTLPVDSNSIVRFWFEVLLGQYRNSHSVAAFQFSVVT